MPPKRRNPRIKPDEQAAITKAARDLSKQINSEVDQLKAESKERTAKAGRPDRGKIQERRRRLRRGQAEKKICKGRNMAGNPCKLATLIPNMWDGPEEITGDYCLWHEPTITRDSAESFELFGTSKRKVPRKVTPGEIAHQLIQRSPQYFLRPYLRSLGLKLDSNTGELVQVSTGLKVHGFSRGGQVIQSNIPDYQAQVQIAEKLFDRVYGKARQAVDLASSTTTVAININMDIERTSKVADVLAQAGALGLNGNGNGNGHKPQELDAAPDTDIIDLADVEVEELD